MGPDLCVDGAMERGIPAFMFPKGHHGLYMRLQIEHLGEQPTYRLVPVPRVIPLTGYRVETYPWMCTH
jgi:hypothetical protein